MRLPFPQEPHFTSPTTFLALVAAEKNGSNSSSTNKNGDAGGTWHVVPWWKRTCPSTYVAQTAAHSPKLTQCSTRKEINLQVASSEASPGHHQGVSARSLQQELLSTSPTTNPILFYNPNSLLRSLLLCLLYGSDLERARLRKLGARRMWYAVGGEHASG